VAAPSRAAERDPFIDLLRVTAVLVVVGGHWLVTSVYWDDAGTRGVNALSVIPWSRLLTWLTQVLPILFFVGGFANATVAARHPGSYLGYLRARLVRLMTPVVALFAVWYAIGLLAEALGRPTVMAHSAAVAAVPLWFLGIYVLVVALAPAMLRLHARAGIGVLVALGAGALLVDIARRAFDVDHFGPLNYAFVWLLPHQLGFWYRDGRLSGRATGWLLAGSGIVGLVALTVLAGYPVSMVGVPGQPVWNTDPPALPLVALTLWLVGLALVLRPVVVRARVAARAVAGKLRHRLLTVYLWHISALPLVAIALYPLGFPQPETGSAQWWLLRPVWLAALTAGMVVLVGLFGRFEVRASAGKAPASSPPRIVAAGVAAVSLATAILGSALTGFSDPFGDGRLLLHFSINPFHNLIHLIAGLAVGWAVLRSIRASIGVALAVGAAFAAAGSMHLASPGALGALGWNEAAAYFHIALGALTVVLIIVTALGSRRSRYRGPAGVAVEP
jgi:hypothetical protein